MFVETDSVRNTCAVSWDESMFVLRTTSMQNWLSSIKSLFSATQKEPAWHAPYSTRIFQKRHLSIVINKSRSFTGRIVAILQIHFWSYDIHKTLLERSSSVRGRYYRK